MSKLVDQLRAMRIFNTHGLLVRFGDDRDVAISYNPNGGRSVRPPWSQVWSPLFKTDPSASWYMNGNRTFLGRKAESLPEAAAWAEQTYGIKEWAPSPFGGDRVPKRVVDRAKAGLKKG